MVGQGYLRFGAAQDTKRHQCITQTPQTETIDFIRVHFRVCPCHLEAYAQRDTLVSTRSMPLTVCIRNRILLGYLVGERLSRTINIVACRLIGDHMNCIAITVATWQARNLAAFVRQR
jgi:hypothetical protein